MVAPDTDGAGVGPNGANPITNSESYIGRNNRLSHLDFVGVVVVVLVCEGRGAWRRASRVSHLVFVDDVALIDKGGGGWRKENRGRWNSWRAVDNSTTAGRYSEGEEGA